MLAVLSEQSLIYFTIFLNFFIIFSFLLPFVDGWATVGLTLGQGGPPVATNRHFPAICLARRQVKVLAHSRNGS